jgi:ankyrin repeat protein
MRVGCKRSSICFLAFFTSIVTSDATGNESEFILAAERGDTDRVAAFLQTDADINARDNRGRTALIYAAINGHTDIVNMLLIAGADTEIEAANRVNALLAAVRHGHLDVVRSLATSGADVNAGNSDGVTPLLAASGLGNKEMVDLLLNKGAEVNARDPAGPSALSTAVDKGYWHVARSLLLKGADINVKGIRGMTVLQRVNASRDTLGARVMLESGVEENAALMLATMLSDTVAVKALLGQGINLDTKDQTGRETLIMAAHQGQHRLLELLLRNSESPPDQDNEIRAILQNAKNRMAYQDTQVARKMFEQGVDERIALHLLTVFGDTTAVKLLLEHGADINAEDRSGKTPLMVAAARGRLGVLKVLLREGADVRKVDIQGKTALRYAASRRRSDNRHAIIDLLRDALIANR